MGLDFIRQAAGTFKKAWNQGVRNLAAPDLFTVNPTCTTRSVLAELVGDSTATSKERLVLQKEGDKLVAFRETRTVAVVAEPQADLLNAVQKCGGVAIVEVEEVHHVSRMVNLAIKE